MRLPVTRKSNRFYPDPRRVIIRFLENNPQQTTAILKMIISLPEDEVTLLLNNILREFSQRHRNITKIFNHHFQKVKKLVDSQEWDLDDLCQTKQLMIGAYFSQEYSIESAAFFNPSIVEYPDQAGLDEGSKRIIVSFRATGEGHISSIVFRVGVIDLNGNFTFEKVGRYIEPAERIKRNEYNRDVFKQKLEEMDLDKEIISSVLSRLNNTFVYGELRLAVEETLAMNNIPSQHKKRTTEQIVWLADSHYEIVFSKDTHPTERVIFPVSYTERNGIEDARFVKFKDDDGKITYYATYTAFSGTTILPKLIETEDFYHFRIRPLHGKGAQNKNLALFPRKINGKYAMFSRIDGTNSYLNYSENINIWDNPILLYSPKYSWEYVKVGNCGSPLETAAGWLVVTHGVGPLRQYSLGAVLLDLEDPTKIIGRLKDPLLVPNDEEREGYVPNVVYSCGSMIHENMLIIPYGISDSSSGFVMVELDKLLKRLE